jgi:transcriptional regulator GlxA family with amidase domain
MARVVVVVYAGAQALDLTGPASVFAAALRRGRSAYDVVYASVGGGPRRITSGLVMHTITLESLRMRRSDTVLVPGGEEPPLVRALADEALIGWLKHAKPRVRRMTSVCSGAFLLAEAGLLDGKRCATHWRACARLAQDYPRIVVDANAIYVSSGRTWTSAGVTAGIDMALALVEADLGRAEVDRIARELVLYVRRPGFQSQFSAALVAQTTGSEALRGALEWAREHMAEATVDGLARRAGVSVRTLHRLCRQEQRTTPGRLLDRMRVERCRLLLSTTDDPLKLVAAASGFDTSTRMKRAFERDLGLAPREYRYLHGAP